MSLIDIYYGLQKMEAGKPITLNIHEGGFELDGKEYTFIREENQKK